MSFNSVLLRLLFAFVLILFAFTFAAVGPRKLKEDLSIQAALPRRGHAAQG